jgi:toxin ParE1/3/4
MKRYIVSPLADRDLDTIERYLVAEAGPRVARKVMRELPSGIRLVARNPGLGHVREDLIGEPLKFWPVYSYLIVYDPGAKPVEIVRVLHGKRNIEQIV